MVLYVAYCIGLDIGIASVGWAVLKLDENDQPYRIDKLGSRIFDAAEHPKDGASLAAPRREARGARRRLRRHKHRLERIRYLIVKENILSEDELHHLYDGDLSDVYMLRTKALDEKVTEKEFARILIHLAQRRGFKSNRKVDVTDKKSDAGALTSAVKENTELMEKCGYRTVGEMFYKDDKFAECKRNKQENYKNTVSRSQIEDEIHLIFEKQREFGQAFASEEIEEMYTDIVLSQRSFEEGPGIGPENCPSPYAGNQIEKKIGKCTFEPDEPRSVKGTYSFELFTLLQKINDIRIINNGKTRCLNADERLMIRTLAHEVSSLNFARIRKELGLNDDEFFKNVSYSDKTDDKKNTVEEIEKKTKFEYLKAYHKMKKALDKGVYKNRINYYDTEHRNAIAYALSVFKTDDKISDYLKNNDIEDIDIEPLLTISGLSGTGHLSTKACDKIIPFLEEGMRYDEACQKAGYDFRAHSNNEKQMILPAYIPEFDNITSPVVRRSVSQSIKVVNAIIREQGESPVFINVELAREMSKNKQERDFIKSQNDKNNKYNEQIIEELKTTFGINNPSGMDIVKLKLFKEQDGVCLYSLKHFDSTRLFEDGYVDIDHIIPYSISFDDSYNNKVLVFSSENRQKGNKIPMQYLSGKRRDDFEIYVKQNVRNLRKKQKLLKPELTEADTDGFKERNLQDTKHISRVMLNLLNDYLEFAPSQTGKVKRVAAVNGAVTGYVRKRWGITKVREDGDLHHAVDAVVIACVTDGMIRKISKYSKYREVEYSTSDEGSILVNRKTGEYIDDFPVPWNNFRCELEIRTSNDPAMYLRSVKLPGYLGVDIDSIKPCFVSRMPKHKVTGAAHKDTIRSSRLLDDGYVLSKKNLTELKLDDNGEIQGYYNPSSDILLYNALKERLKESDGKAAEAFKEPFYKPTSTGEKGPLVKKVKCYEKQSLSVPVHGGTGVAANDSIVRTDVFYVEGEGYYFVPIYVADTIKDELPNRAGVAAKPYSEWKIMSDDNFIFSLYPNDLIKIVGKKKMKLSNCMKNSTLDTEIQREEVFLYYLGFDVASAVANGITHDNTYKFRSIGKTMKSIDKYQVDVLGNYHKVGKEKRMPFSFKKR